MDVAVPRDVDLLAREERNDVAVFKGEIVTAPLVQTLDIGGMPLASGHIYGYLTETILLGLAGFGEHFSYRPLTADHVRRIRHLALQHGFGLEPLPV